MSLNVVQRLLRTLLIAKGLYSKSKPDVWANAVETRQTPTGPERIVGQCFDKALAGRPRRLIVDSGASFHLVDWKNLTPKEKKTKRKMATPYSLTTANGVVTATDEVDIYVTELKIKVTAMILRDTPLLLSLGKLVADHNLEYSWRRNSAPTLRTPSGKIVFRLVMNIERPCRKRYNASSFGLKPVVAANRRHRPSRRCSTSRQRTWICT